MANLIDKVKVKAGRLIRVWNQDRKGRAKETYVSVWVEDASGDNERCLLFTESEIFRAQHRAEKNLEDITTKGWLHDLVD